MGVEDKKKKRRTKSAISSTIIMGGKILVLYATVYSTIYTACTDRVRLQERELGKEISEKRKLVPLRTAFDNRN